MIPACLKLNEKQITKLKQFQQSVVSAIGKDKYTHACTETDCVPSSPMMFTIHATGLGDEIVVDCLGYKCNLTIDDDGEIIEG